jgi:hypothetical protein
MNDQEMLRWLPFIFVGAWVGISLLLSRIGGWHALSLQYRATQPITGQRYWMKSAGMGGVAYRGIVNFGADSSGLFLSVLPPFFSIGHPPLFIPWSDITSSQEKGWLFGGTKLRFQKVPRVSLLIPTELAAKLLANRPLRLEAT